MRILHDIEGLLALPAGCVLSIGNYDGLHLGHQELLRAGRSLVGAGSPGLAVATFEPHPLTVLKPQLAPPRLTPIPLKHQLLERAGADFLVELPPTPSVLGLSAEAFWELLRDKVKPTHLIEGPTFTFGKGRSGNIDKLRNWAGQSAIKLITPSAVRISLVDLQVIDISSSVIRWLLSNGRVRDTAICLGRPYALRGEVVTGHQRGRTIGVPTANIRCDDQMIPADGVYAARATVNGQTYSVALSIGTLPTFGDSARQIEAHLIDFDGDLYGQTLQVDVLEWIRDQAKFGSIDALKAQIARDIAECKTLRNFEPWHPVAKQLV